jgi:hypothetical protein
MTPNQFQELKEMIASIAQPHECDKTGEIAEIAQMQAVIVEQLKAIAETNRKVAETVYGNGKPGLTTIVAETKKDMDAIMAVAKTLLFTLMGLGITAVFYLVLSHGIIK